MHQSPPPQEAPSLSPASPAMPDHVLVTAYQAYQEDHAPLSSTPRRRSCATSSGDMRALPPCRWQGPTTAPPPAPVVPAPVTVRIEAPPAPHRLPPPQPRRPPWLKRQPRRPSTQKRPPPSPRRRRLRAPVAMTHERLTERLVSIISERTGYPTDMLGLDLDVEAELGNRFHQARGGARPASEGHWMPASARASASRWTSSPGLKSLRALVDRIMQEKGRQRRSPCTRTGSRNLHADGQGGRAATTPRTSVPAT